ncbi:MAG: murein L,D-transpeptidase catalytic domain-containing protein [Gemmatimonadaceae bacterium]
MLLRHPLMNGLVVATAILTVGGRYIPGGDQPGPVLAAAVSVVTSTPASANSAESDDETPSSTVSGKMASALQTLTASVRRMSHPQALESAFRGYFAYKTAHPEDVKKPYLYFVDYGIPSTEPRGYVFDMETLEVVDGPFMVAHGRGSSASRKGIPTRFSNANGSYATSLGLYLAQETYGFSGKAAGRSYTSVGLRLLGLSDGWNDNARDRGVVAHGAPYVTPGKAGQSEGCPAIEQGRARRLLPKIANGGMVFLFAPDGDWMSHDPWLAGT